MTSLAGENFVTAMNCYLTNKFHFAVRMYCNRLLMVTEREKNHKVRHETKSSAVVILFFSRYGVFRDLLDRFRSRTRTSF